MDNTEQFDDYLKKVRADAALIELENAAFDRVVGDLARLFGEKFPLLIPCVRGAKMPRKGVTWTKYTEQNLKPDSKESLHYIEQFMAAILDGGNLAVKLGKESGGVLVVDFDTDDETIIGSFLSHNPAFNETLRTRGSRGAAFWYRATGYYPTGVFNIEVPGVGRVGELRCGNRLATVWGKNAAGEDYSRLVDAPLIAFDYKRLRLEAGWTLVESRKESRVRIDWDRFNETVRAEDGGIVEALVARYFPKAVFETDNEWHCANIGGDPPRKKGSFHITPTGWCQDFDGSFPNTGIIDTLLSAQREDATGETLTREEIFASIKEDTGEDFILAPPEQREKLPVLYLPVDGLTFPHEAREVFFDGMARTERAFVRDETFMRVEELPEVGIHLHAPTPDELPGVLSKIFTVKKKFFDPKEKTVKTCDVNCRVGEAAGLLAGRDEMFKFSRPLRLLSASPILVEREGEAKVLTGPGYYPDVGGVYVFADFEPPELSLEKAKNLLLDLYRDYDFVSPGDLSRAIAQTISPALKLGNLLETDYPFDISLADQSQAGKTHRMKIIAAVYGEKAYTITKTTGGVGSFDEKVGAALLSAKLFVLVDNARGDIDSQLLESILRGAGAVDVRVPYRGSIQVSTRRCLWQLTSNAANFTKDLAARSLIVSNRKQPLGYELHHQSSLGWGDAVLVNLARRRAEYLGAVYAVVGEWIRRGKPRTDETRHTFRDWVQAADYIVREILGLAALMEGQATTRQILSDPVVGWLREVALKIEETGQLGKTLQASDLGDLCDNEDITIPGFREPKTASLNRYIERNRQVGKNLKKIFDEVPLEKNPPAGAEGLRCLELETWEVERWEERAVRETKPTKKYRFIKLNRQGVAFP
jgi:hypothetical protein